MVVNRLPDSSKEDGIRLQFSVHVGTKRRCVPDRVIGIASVVETETAIESGPEMVVARGSDQGLRYVDLGHRSCGKSKRGGEKVRGGRARLKRPVVCRIQVRTHLAVGRGMREADIEPQAFLQLIGGVYGESLAQLFI